MSKISVIIPCYNGEKVIDRSIESVFQQAYDDVELIVVDDGSDDDSKKKICAWIPIFEKYHKVLRYVYQKNKGLGAAIDTGLKYVNGEYLIILDADDYFLKNSFMKQADFLDRNPAYAGVRTNGWMIKDTTKQLFTISEKEKTMTDLFEGLLAGQTYNWAGSYMIRSDILFSIYPDRCIYPSRFGQNIQLLLPVAYNNQFGFIDEPLVAYVIQDSSHSRATTAEQQFQKDEKNQIGYRDVYLNTIDYVVTDPIERNKYYTLFDASYYRCGMFRAIKYRKYGLIDERYGLLKSTGYITINDKIAYYQVRKPLLAYVFRVIRKATSLGRGGV